jgi:hypothetical protein
VVDEEGGSFGNFFNKITAGNQETAKKYLLEFQFGWAAMGCDGKGNTYGVQTCCPTPGPQIFSRGVMSCKHRMVVRNISVNVAHGAFKFSIEGTDATMDAFTTHSATTYGTDKNPVRLKLAIEKMIKQTIGAECRFLSIDSACQVKDFEWRVEGDIDPKEGAYGKWEVKRRNPIQAARDWLNSYVSKRGKGIVTYFDSTAVTTPTLVFMESNLITCESNRDMDAWNVGTYIVNGSSCSPVLSFTPTIQYVMDQAMAQVSGVPGGSLASPMFVEEQPCLKNKPNTKNQGMQSTQTESDNSYRIWGKWANKFAGRNKMDNQAANVLSPPITAEMRVQGDPSYDKPIFFRGHYCSVVYFNPFRIFAEGTDCGWVAKSGCNSQLSNTNWQIDKVFHEIKEGSFSTTLKLILAAPGLDIPRDAPLGASPLAPQLG